MGTPKKEEGRCNAGRLVDANHACRGKRQANRIPRSFLRRLRACRRRLKKRSEVTADRLERRGVSHVRQCAPTRLTAKRNRYSGGTPASVSRPSQLGTARCGRNVRPQDHPSPLPKAFWMGLNPPPNYRRAQHRVVIKLSRKCLRNIIAEREAMTPVPADM
jgi:hypothetical protein